MAIISDDLDKELIRTAFSAFAGAFCAFVFLRLAEALKAYYERLLRHCRALSKLLFVTNELIDAINLNLYEIDQFTTIIQRGRDEGRIPICPNRPQALPFDGTVLLDLTNADLINELFSLQCTIRRFNGDTHSIATMYDMFRDAVIRDKSYRDTYLSNCDMCIRKMVEMRKHLVDLNDRTIHLAATVRVRLKRDRPLFLKLMGFLLRTHHEKRFQKALDQEMEQVKKEVKMVKTQSRDAVVRVSQQEDMAAEGGADKTTNQPIEGAK